MRDGLLGLHRHEVEGGTLPAVGRARRQGHGRGHVQGRPRFRPGIRRPGQGGLGVTGSGGGSGDPKFHALWRFSVDGNTDPVRLTTTDDFCAGRPSAAPGGSDAPVAFAGTRGPFDEIFNQIWIVRPPSPKICACGESFTT